MEPSLERATEERPQLRSYRRLFCEDRIGEPVHTLVTRSSRHSLQCHIRADFKVLDRVHGTASGLRGVGARTVRVGIKSCSAPGSQGGPGKVCKPQRAGPLALTDPDPGVSVGSNDGSLKSQAPELQPARCGSCSGKGAAVNHTWRQLFASVVWGNTEK